MAKSKATKEVAEMKVKKASIEIEVNEAVYKGKADSLDQALRDFVNSQDFPQTIKTRAVIKFSDGKSEGQVVWPVIKARRQFNLMGLKPYWAELVSDKFESNLANG